MFLVQYGWGDRMRLTLAYMLQALCGRHCCKHFCHISPLNHQLGVANTCMGLRSSRHGVFTHSDSVCTITLGGKLFLILILQMEKLKHREVQNVPKVKS